MQIFSRGSWGFRRASATLRFPQIARLDQGASGSPILIVSAQWMPPNSVEQLTENQYRLLTHG
ncbi:MAG TPA: hypothetical protein PKN00_20085, partial [Sedimentisphaerales bacterium]|nr:hypothetical protein [Sedimentisphaerales bacterium]